MNFIKKSNHIPSWHHITLLTVVSLFAVSSYTFSANSTTTELSSAVSPDTASWFTKIENWYANNMNYGTITVLMAAESSIFPVPSELVVPPAAYIASQEDSSLNMFLVILFATIGALIGATANYFILGKWLGRSVIYKFADSRMGKMLLLSGEKIEKTEVFFNKYGIMSTFIGRFIPVIRHFISIPAGFAKMNYLTFSVFTFIGAGLWNCILALLGYWAHGQQDMINKYAHEFGYGLLALVGLGVVYLVVKHFLKKRKSNKSANGL